MGEGGIPGDDQSDTRQPPRPRLTVSQAAEALGVTVDAVRSRIKRRTIDHVREGGRIYVLLDASRAGTRAATSTDRPTDQGDDQGEQDSPPATYQDELVEELRDRVRALEDANRENRRIIAALTSRIPELQASSETRDVPETVPEPEPGTEHRPAMQDNLDAPGGVGSLGSSRDLAGNGETLSLAVYCHLCSAQVSLQRAPG
jgi:hypothetical protein